MVPKSVGDELRRRRIGLRMKQAEVARQLGTTRAYVSALERGVTWDPDADKLVQLARIYEWPDDHILRRLNRLAAPLDPAPRLTPEVVGAIRETIAAGIRDAMDELIRALRDGTDPVIGDEPTTDEVVTTRSEHH